MRQAFKVGTRGSPLALAQAREVADRLRALRPEIILETVAIRTHGDEGLRTHTGASLDGKRAFTKRIEDALLEGRIDCAVHSLKDLPTSPVEGLTIAAIPPRADPRDALVTKDGRTSDDLPADARVGTSSLRRRAQLLARWPRLQVGDLRGNLETRLRRLGRGEFDALVVAAAGFHRLQVGGWIAEPLPPDLMTPAPGQGALAVQARTDDEDILEILGTLDDPAARRTTEAERELSARMGGGCNVPFGALATMEDECFDLRAFVASPDGRRIVRARVAESAARWREAVDAAWSQLLEGGGRRLLAGVA